MAENKFSDPGSPGRRLAEPRKRLWLIPLCLSLVLLLAVGAAVGFLFLYDNVFPGVSVGTTSLSGLSRQEALTLLDREYSALSPAQTLPVTVGEYELELDMSNTSLRYDASEAVADAFAVGRTGNIFERAADVFTSMTSGVFLSPPIKIDVTALDKQISVLADELWSDLAQPAYEIRDNFLILDRGQEGIYVDIVELSALVREQVISGDLSPVVYHPQVEQPDALDLERIADEIAQPMQNPTLDLENDATGNTILPAKRGIALDIDGALRALELSSERYVELPLTITEPTMTTRSEERRVGKEC